MNNYETVFIATPVLSDAQTKELLGKFQGVITENGGQIVNTEEWGLKKLEYPIQKKSTGFYFRFLTFRQDKHAVEYSAKRRAKLAGRVHEAKTAVEAAAAQPETETVKSEEE